MSVRDTEWRDWQAKGKARLALDDFLSFPAGLTWLMGVALIDLWFALARIAAPV